MKEGGREGGREGEGEGEGEKGDAQAHTGAFTKKAGAGGKRVEGACAEYTLAAGVRCQSQKPIVR